jgi:acyl-coenzyme A synthetase/AMP-(fatty) acid ligase
VLQGDRYVFAGRRDGVINVGGQKVHPEEVEAVINAHPRVQMSLVRARRNAITGAIVVADIVARAEAEAMPAGQLEEDVKALCRARLAPHKIPAAIRLVPQLTIAPSGKLVRPHA